MQPKGFQVRRGRSHVAIAPVVYRVGTAGFEPATSASRTLRATKLRYVPEPVSVAPGRAGSDRGRSRRIVASGRQQNRNGAYLLVPRPREVYRIAGPIRIRPATSRRGIEQFVTIAPMSGSHVCPPCVWLANIRSYPSAAVSGAESGECITATPNRSVARGVTRRS